MVNTIIFAVVNTIFNVAATIVLAPMSKLFEKITVMTIKDNDAEEDDIEEDFSLLDERFLDHPTIALEQCGNTMNQMVHVSFKNLRKATSLLML